MEPAPPADPLATGHLEKEPHPAGDDRAEKTPWVPDRSQHPWDGYLTGPENELAMAAAQALARGERDGISPLIVHGPSGTGKSRLLAGLVVERLRREPGTAVAHLDAQAFVAACVEAAGVAGGAGWAALRGRFRSVNLLVLEDLEGLERGPLAHDELTYTLDALDDAGAIMVFSARSAPATWSKDEWPRRLLNRLSGGLVAKITLPGLASRRRYILQNASRQGIAIHAEAVETLAQAADGYRTLDGWISRLALEARMKQGQPRRGGSGADQRSSSRPGQSSSGSASASPSTRSPAKPLDVETVAAILAEETLLAGARMTIDAVARRVAERFNVRLSVLRGPSRRSSVVLVRHVAMHLARVFTGSSFATIGAYFGGRDAATVRHACKAAALRLQADPSLAAAVASLEPRAPGTSA